MKPKSLSIALIILFMVYGYYVRLTASKPAQIVATAPATLDSSQTPAQSSTPEPAPTPAPVAPTQSIRRGEDDEESITVAAKSQPTTSQPAPTTTPAPAPKQTSTTMGSGNSTMGMMIQYKNGTYTGAVADAFYGNVQVKITVSGGKLTDVTFLQSPGDRQTSRDINAQAMPMLRQQAILAQSAQVNGVSGASATSQAFVQSLGDALAQAKV